MKRVNTGKLSIIYFDDEKIKRMLVDSKLFKTRKDIVNYLEKEWNIKINIDNLRIKPFKVLDD